jgi:hypothetical protein
MGFAQGSPHGTDDLKESLTIPDKNLEDIRQLANLAGRREKVRLRPRGTVPDKDLMPAPA